MHSLQQKDVYHIHFDNWRIKRTQVVDGHDFLNYLFGTTKDLRALLQFDFARRDPNLYWSDLRHQFEYPKKVHLNYQTRYWLHPGWLWKQLLPLHHRNLQVYHLS